MKKTDNRIASLLEDIMYPDPYGWPPVCTGLLYQPERPVMLKPEKPSNIPEQENE